VVKLLFTSKRELKKRDTLFVKESEVKENTLKEADPF
jgi:hypothetical protein